MDYNEQLEKERREEEEENFDELVDLIEEYNEKFSGEEFQGIDYSISESLGFYGMLLQEESPGEYFIIYCREAEGRYFLDWSRVFKDDLLEVVEDMEEGFFKFVDTGKNEIIREIKGNNIGAIINTIDSINRYNGYFDNCLGYHETLEQWISWFNAKLNK